MSGRRRPRHSRGARYGYRPVGFISRTIRGLTRKFGVPKSVVIVGFVMLFIMSAPLAIVAFLASWYWVSHPGKIEAAFDWAIETSRQIYNETPRQASHEGTPSTTAGSPHGGHDFSDLRAKFADLEKRAGRVEEYVSSDDYALVQEFNNIDKS